ncbi:hypothetical protein L0U85_03345 [Glycomyces sp. L485]|uniref:hypothetical protein n=1 Tax=Glycomyces sp. L485 TaxID=2909235 RepID=UPI001F4AD5DC|nr:hypothetical protein [Glycomyces sp. L485]MCH7229897.1 hypothetical protein [Glycomyces sp. L485]
MGRITITSRSAPQLGRTRADFHDDWTLPATCYRLDGPRISGTVTVWAEAEPAFDHPPVLEDCDVHVLLGHGDPHRRHYNFVDRKDLDDPLTVNGVEIARHQTSTYFHPLLLADADRCGGFLSWNLPDRTRESATTLLRFVALHWVRRDPEYLVHCINATSRGLGRWQAERRKRMTRLHRGILDDYQALERLRAVGYDAHLYRLAPPPGPRSEEADSANDTTTKT